MTQSDIEKLIGVKLLVLVAGFFGAVLSLSFNRKLSIVGAFLSVIAGVSCAAFLTPLISYFWVLPVQIENGIAFLLGLVGLLLMGKVYIFFSRLDLATVVRLRGDKTEEDDK